MAEEQLFPDDIYIRIVDSFKGPRVDIYQRLDDEESVQHIVKKGFFFLDESNRYCEYTGRISLEDPISKLIKIIREEYSKK